MGLIERAKELVLGSYSHTAKDGRQYFLHEKDGRGGTRLYYFSKSPEGAISLPDGYEVVESQRGLPLLRKVK